MMFQSPRPQLWARHNRRTKDERQRKVVDARQDDNGKITSCPTDGNRNMTPIGKAINMAEQGQLVNAHAVTRQDGTQRLSAQP